MLLEANLLTLVPRGQSLILCYEVAHKMKV